MKRFLSIFRSPVALGGLIAAGIVLAVAAAALVTGGFSLAQTATPTATSTAGTSDAATATTQPKGTETPSAKGTLREDFLNGLAKQLGVSREKLDAALKQSGLDMVDKALADGKITQAEADRIRTAIQNGELPFFGFHGHHGGPCLGRHVVGDVATFLGITEQDVVTALTNGQSLAAIAKDHGKSRDDLKGYLTTQFDQGVDAKVKNNDITADRATQLKQKFSDNLDTLIDRTGWPDHGPKMGGFREPPESSPTASPQGTSDTF